MRQKQLRSAAEKQVLQRGRRLRRGIELMEMHDLLNFHSDVLKAFDRFAAALQVSLEDGCLK